MNSINPMNSKTLKTYNIVFYSLVAAAFLFIFLTNPFLIKLYDPWRYHLASIAEFYNGVSGSGRIWHLVWAHVFKFFGISNIFTWAKIIHVFQFLLAAVVMYYFSKTALNILIKSPLSPLLQSGVSKRFSPQASRRGDLTCGNDNKKINELRTIQIKFLSLFSVFLWFIGNGTFSVAYQQAWIMWYSVTYQGLSIPLFWYCTALTLKIFYVEMSLRRILLYIILIAITSVIIAKLHPMEFLYYIINLVLILLVNSKRLLNIENKKYLLISLPVILIIMILAVKYLIDRESGLSILFTSNETPVQIIQKINIMGNEIVSTLNRFPNSFSEVARVSIFAAVLFRIVYLFRKDKSQDSNAIYIYDYLLVSSLVFVLIPIIPFLAGAVGYITNPVLVWRCFFGSPWFIFLPFIIYNYKE